MTKNTPFLKFTTVAVLAAATSVSHSATLVDSGLGGTLGGLLGNTGKAVVFRTTSSAYSLESATVRLNLPTTEIISGLNVALYAGATNEFSSVRPTGSPLVTFTFPVIETTGVQNVTLTPSAPFTLAADSTYFFVMWGNDSAAGATWLYDNSTPSSGEGFTFPDVNTATNLQYGWYNGTGNTLSNPVTWGSYTSVYNDLQLTGSIVPEPSSVMMLSSLGVLGLVRRRR